MIDKREILESASALGLLPHVGWFGCVVATNLSILGQPSRRQFKYLRQFSNHRKPKVSAIRIHP